MGLPSEEIKRSCESVVDVMNWIQNVMEAKGIHGHHADSWKKEIRRRVASVQESASADKHFMASRNSP
jgi:hypothetical protein